MRLVPESLQPYRRSLSGYDELPGVIEEVSQQMGLRGFENPDGPVFTADVLQTRFSELPLDVINARSFVTALETRFIHGATKIWGRRRWGAQIWGRPEESELKSKTSVMASRGIASMGKCF